MLPYRFTFHANEADDLHCLQSSLRMAWHGLRGEPLTLEAAEKMTAFAAGRQTWPFAAMLSLSERGFSVRSIEDFDPAAFIADPEQEILRQTGDADTAQHVMAVSDPLSEIERVRRCLHDDHVHFEHRRPGIVDVQSACAQPNTAVICNVNYHALAGQPGYTGHFVLVEDVSDGRVLIQNPGLPAIENQSVSVDRFTTAWQSPRESMANLLIISSDRQ